MNLKDLNNEISTLRQTARREAKKEFTFVQSRGLSILFLKNSDRTMDEPFEVSKSLITGNELRHALNYGKSLGANGFWIAGGYDGSDYFDGFCDGNYDPWVSEFDIELPTALILKYS